MLACWQVYKFTSYTVRLSEAQENAGHTGSLNIHIYLSSLYYSQATVAMNRRPI